MIGLWRLIGRRNQIILLSVVICLVIAAASGGCYAHRLPAGRAQQAGEPLPYTVSVIAWNADAAQAGRDPSEYAKALAALVAGSHAFKDSRFETAPAANADLVAISTGLKCESSVVPIFTILTLGIIPTVFDGERCDGLILRSPRPGSAAPIEIKVRTKEQTVIGWAALGFGALGNWGYGRVGDDRDYGSLLRLEVARLKPEIDKLAASAPPEPPADPAPSPAEKTP